MKNTDRPCKSPRLPFNQKTQRHTYTHYEKESQYVKNTTMRVRYPEKKKKGSHPRTKKIHKRPPKPQIIHPCHGSLGHPNSCYTVRVYHLLTENLKEISDRTRSSSRLKKTFLVGGSHIVTTHCQSRESIVVRVPYF